MVKTKRKGFTIIELVIVIAVIAVLAAVLIPTFANLINKTQLSADQQAVVQMNIALAADEAMDGKPESVEEAREILAENGYKNLRDPLLDGYKFMWISADNRVALCSVGADKISVTYPKELADKYKDATAEAMTGWYNLVPEPVPAEHTLTVQSNISLITGQTVKLDLFADGIRAVADKWESANTAVATVNENGTVTAVAAGTTSITATYAFDNQTKTATCTITVTDASTEDTQPVDVSNATIKGIDGFPYYLLGGEEKVTLSLNFEEGKTPQNYLVKWASGAEQCSTVDGNGSVYFHKVGSAKFTATVIQFYTENGEIKKEETTIESKPLYVRDPATVEVYTPQLNEFYENGSSYYYTINLDNFEGDLTTDVYVLVGKNTNKVNLGIGDGDAHKNGGFNTELKNGNVNTQEAIVDLTGVKTTGKKLHYTVKIKNEGVKNNPTKLTFAVYCEYDAAGYLFSSATQYKYITLNKTIKKGIQGLVWGTHTSNSIANPIKTSIKTIAATRKESDKQLEHIVFGKFSKYADAVQNVADENKGEFKAGNDYYLTANGKKINGYWVGSTGTVYILSEDAIKAPAGIRALFGHGMNGDSPVTQNNEALTTVKSITFQNFDVSDTTEFKDVFAGCTNLENIYVTDQNSDWITGKNINNFSNIFYGCDKLITTENGRTNNAYAFKEDIVNKNSELKFKQDTDFTAITVETEESTGKKFIKLYDDGYGNYIKTSDNKYFIPTYNDRYEYKPNNYKSALVIKSGDIENYYFAVEVKYSSVIENNAGENYKKLYLMPLVAFNNDTTLSLKLHTCATYADLNKLYVEKIAGGNTGKLVDENGTEIIDYNKQPIIFGSVTSTKTTGKYYLTMKEYNGNVTDTDIFVEFYSPIESFTYSDAACTNKSGNWGNYIKADDKSKNKDDYIDIGSKKIPAPTEQNKDNTETIYLFADSLIGADNSVIPLRWGPSSTQLSYMGRNSGKGILVEAFNGNCAVTGENKKISSLLTGFNMQTIYYTTEMQGAFTVITD